MDKEKQTLAEEIFVDALAVDAVQREPFLAHACAGDADLLFEVRSLLEAARDADEYFDDLSSRLGASVSCDESNSADAGVVGRPGLVVGPYKLEKPVGRGGTGTVWLARRTDGEFDGEVAIKLMQPRADASAALARLGREAQHLAKLSHPNIARLLDSGSDADDRPYLILEYVRGLPIDEYCDAKRLGISDRIRLFLHVLEAVGHAHSHLIVHRDIKPSNVLVDESGNVKLLDFGIAKLMPAAVPGGLGGGATIEIGSALTPEFAAPEQLAGTPITTVTDVYALGLLLYVLLTGSNPLRNAAADSLAKLISTASGGLPRASTVVSGSGDVSADGDESSASRRRMTPAALVRALRGDLENVVGKALEPEPTNRYRSVAEFSADLQRYLEHEPVSAVAPTIRYRLRKFVRRHRVGVATGSLFVIGMFAAVAVTTYQMMEARAQSQRAEQIQRFLVGLFGEADPLQSKGAEVTAREMLDRGIERLDRELAGQDLVRADILYSVGTVYMNLSMSERSVALLEESARLREAMGENHDEAYATTLEELAYGYENRGDFNQAETIARQALDVRLALGDSTQTAIITGRLGSIIHRQQRLDEAERLYRDALFMLRENGVEDHELFSRTLHGLGALLEQRGQLAEAARYHREGLERRRASLVEDHYDMIESYYNVGSIEQAQGNLASARENYEQALALSRKLVPDGHTDAAYMINALGTVHEELGEFDLAERRYREALAVLHRFFDEDHPNIGIVGANLGVLLAKIGDDDASEDALTSSLNIMLRTIPDHPKVLLTQLSLGKLLTRREAYAEAEATYLAAREFLLETGDEHSQLTAVEAAIAEVRELMLETNSANGSEL